MDFVSAQLCERLPTEASGVCVCASVPQCVCNVSGQIPAPSAIPELCCCVPREQVTAVYATCRKEDKPKCLSCLLTWRRALSASCASQHHDDRAHGVLGSCLWRLRGVRGASEGPQKHVAPHRRFENSQSRELAQPRQEVASARYYPLSVSSTTYPSIHPRLRTYELLIASQARMDARISTS